MSESSHSLSGELSILESFAGKHIVVTGVTGFLGKVWLAMVLHRVPTIRKITCLARGKKELSGQQRVRESVEISPAFRAARAEMGHDLLDSFDAKVKVYQADLARPECGLSETEIAEITADADAIVHFAGLTDFEPDPMLAIDTNIRGTLNIAELATKLRDPLLIHVSTCFVAGMVSGDIPEHVDTGVGPNGTRFDPQLEIEGLIADVEAEETKSGRIDAANRRAHRLGWPNIYTLTKGLGEHVLEHRTDLRTVTVRPAIVECARNYPFPGWNEGCNTSGPIVWLFSTSFRHFPAQPEHRFDVIPVDTVARGMMLVTAQHLSGEGDAVYQLGSSGQNPITFRRAIELTNLGIRRMHGKSSNPKKERLLLRHLDVVPVAVDEEPMLGVGNIRRAAQSTRKWIRKLDLKKNLPPSLYDSVGHKADAKLKSWSMECRNTDRMLGRVQDMLRLYQPFIHDHDYVFLADHVEALSTRLPQGEADFFQYDMNDVDWRHYWLEIQMPGLEKWCLPVLEGEEIPQDAPLPSREKSPRPPKQSPAFVAAE